MKHKVAVVCCLAMLLLTACSEQQNTQLSVNQASEQEAKKTYEWKLVTSWPKNFPGLGTAPEKLAVWINEMSAGRMNVRVYGAGEFVQGHEVFDTVSNGAAEMGHSAAYYWQGKVPVATFFAGVPFGMNAMEVNAWIHHGGGLELWRELYAPFNLIPFAAGNSGVQMAGWFNKEINSLEDLQGLKMRIPGLGGKVFSEVGGVPDNLPGPEIYTALQTGVIDATEWVGPVNDLAFALHDIAEYYYYPGWHEPGTILELMVNKEAWSSLPTDLQRIIEVGARAINQDMLDEFTAANFVALRTLVEEHGVELRKLPDDVLQRLRAESDLAMREVVDSDDELGQRVIDSYIGFMEQVRAYGDVSENAYANALNKTHPVEISN